MDRIEVRGSQARQDWAGRHNAAIVAPFRAFEGPIVGMFRALEQYAADHNRRFDSPIGEDGVLGVAWQRMACALIDLLNGESGRLDCGTLDGAIRKLAEDNGVALDS